MIICTTEISYAYCDVITKLVLSCFAVSIWNDSRLTYTKMTEAYSLKSNALNMKSHNLYANFHNTAENLSVCGKFSHHQSPNISYKTVAVFQRR